MHVRDRPYSDKAQVDDEYPSMNSNFMSQFPLDILRMQRAVKA